MRTLAALVATLPGAWQLWTLLRTLAARVAYPFDIEWMEGSHLYHAYRILHGLYLYGDPARGFATFPYPPMFWIVLAGTGSIFGLDYWVGRAVSLACLFGVAVILAGAIVRAAPTRAVAAAFCVVALAGISAGFPYTGGAYDLARNDTMAIFFPVLAAALAGEGRLSTARALAVGAALTAALYTKQTGVFYALWLIGFALARDLRGGIRLACATGLASAAVLAVLCVLTGGWFWTLIFDLANHGFRAHEWTGGTTLLLTHAPFLLLFPWLVAELARRRWLRPTTLKWTGLFGAALVATIVSYLKVGAWQNVLIPAFVLSWPVTLLLLCDLLRGLHARRVARALAFCGTLAASAALAWLLAYDTSLYVPSAARWQEAARVRALVRGLDGEVVVVTHPFLAIREGKTAPQPILQGYLDAKLGGINADYTDCLVKSGADYVVTTGRAPERDLRPHLSPAFEWVRDLDERFDSLADWDHPERSALFRRAGAPPLDRAPPK